MCRGQRETVGYSERTIVRYPQGMVRRTSLKAPVLACLLPQHRLFHGGAAVRQCWPSAPAPSVLRRCGGAPVLAFCSSTVCSTAVRRCFCPSAACSRRCSGTGLKRRQCGLLLAQQFLDHIHCLDG